MVMYTAGLGIVHVGFAIFGVVRGVGGAEKKQPATFA